jgi:hypothetical protein
MHISAGIACCTRNVYARIGGSGRGPVRYYMASMSEREVLRQLLDHVLLQRYVQ